MSTQAPSPDNLPRPARAGGPRASAGAPRDTDAVPAPGSGAEPPEPEEDSSKALFEELDALLERMLSLPVSYAEESDAADAPRDSSDQVPLITIAEAMLEPSPPPYSAPLPPVTATDEAFAAQAGLGFTPPPPPVSELRTAPLSPDRASGVSNLPGPRSRPGSLLTPLAEPSAAPPAPEKSPDTFVPPPPLWLWPLVWCNRAFDGCTVPLGPLGHWLRGVSGRAALGWTGLLMLAVAGGLFLNSWFGWTW